MNQFVILQFQLGFVKEGIKMVNVSDLNIGQVLKNEFEGITRDLLKQYAKASGDTKL